MQIKSIGFEKQYGLRGQIVNVPIDIDSTVTALPRNVEDSFVIELHIKRKMNYKSDYMCESVRPMLLYKAGQFLEQTPLYKLYGVSISEKFYDNITDNFGIV